MLDDLAPRTVISLLEAAPARSQANTLISTVLFFWQLYTQKGCANKYDIGTNTIKKLLILAGKESDGNIIGIDNTMQ